MVSQAMQNTPSNMKTRMILLSIVVDILIVGGIVCYLFAAKSHWQRYTSTAGQFSVLFPGKPVEDVFTQPMPGGDITSHQIALDGGKQGVSFDVQYTDFPHPVKTAGLSANFSWRATARLPNLARVRSPRRSLRWPDIPAWMCNFAVRSPATAPSAVTW